jgi:hypothetical protein
LKNKKKQFVGSIKDTKTTNIEKRIEGKDMDMWKRYKNNF